MKEIYICISEKNGVFETEKVKTELEIYDSNLKFNTKIEKGEILNKLG
jgi:hypothetical protein